MRILVLGIALVAGCAASKKEPESVGTVEGPTEAGEKGQVYTLPSSETHMVGVMDGVYGYCHMPDAGFCGEFPPDQVAGGEQACQGRGNWSTNGCPREGILGTCTNPVRGGGARLWLYSPRYATEEEARLDMCSDADDVFEAGVH